MNMLETAAVLGHGVVGQATRLIMAIPEENCYDKQLTKKQMEEVAKKRFIFICLPTPTVDGETDLSLIDNYIRDLTAYDYDPIFIIRSTVPVGTCNNLADKYKVAVVHNPEFFTEATAMKDAMDPDFTLIGADDSRSLYETQEIYDHVYSKFIITDTKTAEMIKYAINSFYATKVVFANVIYDLCNEIGVSYEDVKHAMYNTKTIGKNHLSIMHKGYRGAGGKCLGKDLDSFTHQFEHPFFTSVNELNKEFLNEKP